MRRTDIKVLVLAALVIGLLAAIYSCSNPKAPVDSQAPAVAITNPVNNSRVPTAVDVRAEATDNTAVTKVEFYIDSDLFYTDRTPPWSCYWTLTEEESAEHTIFAKAFDAAGNSKSSEVVTVTCENMPPSVIADLAATDADINGNLTLTWTAPGESEDIGTPTQYDIRSYWVALTDENWASGTSLEGVPEPQEAGSAESFDVTGLTRSTTYFFAIRTQDSAGNWSGISNNVMVEVPGILAAGEVYEVGLDANPSILVEDLNGDSHPDIAISYRSLSNNFSVMLGKGDGTFFDPVYYSMPINPGTFCALDIDDDGALDFAVPDWDQRSVVYTSMSTWTEIISRPDPVMGFPNIIDTVINFIETHVNQVAGLTILEGVGDGSFDEGWEIFVDIFYAHCMNTLWPEVLDYIVHEGDTCYCQDYDTYFYENPDDDEECMNPDSNMYFPATPVMDWTRRAAIASCAGDFNNDDYMDAAFLHYTLSRVGVMLNNGAGELLPPDTSANNGGTLPTAICTGDFTGDGWLDLAVANSSASRVAMLRNRGDGTFATAQLSIVGTTPMSVVAGDFDGDGDLDIASANYGAASVSILYNQGTGTFPTNPQTCKAGWGPSGIAAADMTGDETLDLVVANFNDDNVTVLINEGLYRYYSDNSVYFGVGDGPSAVGCGDFDGDGDIDVAVLNESDGTISILLNQVDHGI